MDTSFNLERYKQLIESKDNQTTADIILEYALYNEFTYASRYSLARVAMVGNGHINRLATELPKVSELNATSVRVEGENSVSHINSVGLLKDFHSSDIIWMDSSKRELSEKEIIVSSDFFYEHTPDYPNALPPDFKSDHVKQSVVNNQYSITVYNYFNEDFTPVTINGYKVVGVLDSETLGLFSTAIFSDSFAMQLLGDSYGLYDSAIGAMPIGRDNIKKTISFCFNETEPIRYELKNSVTYELEAVHSILKALSKVFLYIGIGFALFAALMLANFIGISISHKKQEIGILRAIGSRSNDVFRIFFAESFIIAMINFVLSAVSVGFATVIINNIIRQQGILITVLSFGIRQISLLFAVSIVVAFVASFLPVKKIASKRPIDAIKNR